MGAGTRGGWRAGGLGRVRVVEVGWGDLVGSGVDCDGRLMGNLFPRGWDTERWGVWRGCGRGGVSVCC